ncbi:MAG: hypothetical protein ITF98_06800 [Fermentimonas sp.]|nr:hypothetical protein [Fermentimonas sp.]
MFDLKIISHSELESEILNEIISVKSVPWDYSYENQLEWINNNLKNNDLHLLLFMRNKSVAYLNLISIDLIIDKVSYKAFGVGNVCAIEKAKGYGKELMKLTNKFIVDNQKLGLLFCKSELASFYLMNNWRLVDKNKITLSFDDSNITSMLYNFKGEYNSIIYNSRPF